MSTVHQRCSPPSHSAPSADQQHFHSSYISHIYLGFPINSIQYSWFHVYQKQLTKMLTHLESNHQPLIFKDCIWSLSRVGKSPLLSPSVFGHFHRVACFNVPPCPKLASGDQWPGPVECCWLLHCIRDNYTMLVITLLSWHRWQIIRLLD